MVEPSALEDFTNWSRSGVDSKALVTAIEIAVLPATEDSTQGTEACPPGLEVHGNRIPLVQIDNFWQGSICLYSDLREATDEKDRCRTNSSKGFTLYDPDKPTFDRTPLRMEPYLRQLKRSHEILKAISQLPPELVSHIIREYCLENDIRHMTYTAWRRLEWDSHTMSIIILRPMLHSDMWYLGTLISAELRKVHESSRIQFYTWDVEHPASRRDLWHIYDRFHRNNPNVPFLFFAEPEVCGARYLGLVEQHEDDCRWVRKIHFSQSSHIWTHSHDDSREDGDRNHQGLLDTEYGAKEQEVCIELLLNYDDPLPHLQDDPATSEVHTDPVETQTG